MYIIFMEVKIGLLYENISFYCINVLSIRLYLDIDSEFVGSKLAFSFVRP